MTPLVQDGLKLFPSVTRVFRATHDIFIYLQAYQQGAEPAPPLAAFVTFYRVDNKAFQSAPITIAEALPKRLRTMPLKFQIPFANLSPGEYLCQVTVLDARRRKAAFWRTTVMLVP